VAQAQAYVTDGYRFVVDIDLAKFFDRVNHDKLIARVAARIPDRRVLRLIRSYLTAGVLNNGLFEASREGTPQGGPLSPLLSDLVLDELHRELARRGHRFVRYADDCNIYVRGETAGLRVMTTTEDPQPRRRIADKAVARFKDRVRGLTRRHRGVSLERMIARAEPAAAGMGRL
jgi:RNA-directed DNA polymerase